MKILVVMKQVPDLADELEISDDGNSLDPDAVTWVLNEFDDHALEEALQLKDALGGSVAALALGSEAVDKALFTALAKGADEAKKVGEFEGGVSSHVAAEAFAAAIGGMEYDLILTGVQAIDDLDGQVGPLLATKLEIPHVSVVTHVEVSGDAKSVTVHQEYAGGVLAEFEVDLPAVLGIQAARATPRYAPVSRVRQLQKEASLETIDGAPSGTSGLEVERLFVPETGGHAEMIEGDEDEAAEKIVNILEERGLLPK
ncbi:MAG: electron transfer flavoprotein subunit beta/FixA family protein [Gemmatimonadota bacterium]|nr:electron transfer flavoprotein subunit beta/FixA family protein [Gemmatimonadota bacterium]MDH5804327.1 electron transfer flavoprotein subunit beta/FixA family protein [Gemmatimonadota bacterium]